MSKDIIDKLANAGLSKHKIGTLLYYFQVIEKYNALKVVGLDHWEICDKIGLDEKHYYRIRNIIVKVKTIV